MTPNPFLGVLFHAIGGFAAGSFYIPFKRVRGWAWETYWLVGGLFIWVICPAIIAFVTVPNLLDVYREAAWPALTWPFLMASRMAASTDLSSRIIECTRKTSPSPWPSS